MAVRAPVASFTFRFGGGLMLLCAALVLVTSMLGRVLTGGVISFISSRDGSYKIYATDLMRGWTFKVTNQRTMPCCLHISMNGQRLAFTSYTEKNDDEWFYDIYTMDVDGSHARPVIVSDSGLPLNPVWSPDGTRIAFGERRSTQVDIFVVNADGTDERRLTHSLTNDNFPVWSPDGTQIAYIADHYGSTSIYVVDAACVTGCPGPRRLFAEGNEEASPVWSPDGKQIAFVSQTDDHSDLYLINADGSDSRPLTQTEADDHSPAWSPDGTQIAFISDQSGLPSLYVINADGSGQRRLTRSLEPVFAPIWSPDGKRIAYQVGQRESSPQIHIVNVATELGEILTNDNFTSIAPVWWVY